MKTRIKFKSSDQISIIDILTIHSITSKSDILYIYIDDRSDYYNVHCDDVTEILLKELKSINLSTNQIFFVKYSDHYNLAWIYLHKLMMDNEIVIEPNQWNDHNDFENMTNNKKNLKIYLADENNDKYMHKSNNILYNCGWFREGFLELIIDDSLKINYIFDDRIRPLSKLIELLNLHCPCSKQNIALPIIDKKRYSIFDLSLSDMCDLKIYVFLLVYFYENKMYYLDELSDICVEYHVHPSSDLSNDLSKNLSKDPWCLIDPIKILLEDSKIIGSSKICDYIYVQKYEYADSHNIRLNYGGALYVQIIDNMLHGKWLRGSKKKKIKRKFEWMTNCSQNIYYTINQLIILSSDHINHSNKIFKINNDFFIKDDENKMLIKLHKKINV